MCTSPSLMTWMWRSDEGVQHMGICCNAPQQLLAYLTHFLTFNACITVESLAEV